MNAGKATLIFLIAMIALVAEFIAYFIVGIGTAFSGSGSITNVAAFFVGLMIITGGAALVAPFSAFMGWLINKVADTSSMKEESEGFLNWFLEDISSSIFYILMGLVTFFGLFVMFVIPLISTEDTSTSTDTSELVSDTVNTPAPKTDSTTSTSTQTGEDLVENTDKEKINAIEDINYEINRERVIVTLSSEYLNQTKGPYNIGLYDSANEEAGLYLLGDVEQSGNTLIFNPNQRRVAVGRQGIPLHENLDYLLVSPSGGNQSNYYHKALDVPSEYGPVLKPLQELSSEEIAVRVEEAQSFDTMASSFDDKSTSGKFIKVYLLIENRGDSSKNLLDYDFKLRDSEGRTFDTMSATATMYTTDILSSTDSLQPGVVKEGAVIFEVPNEVENVQILLNERTGLQTNTILQLAVPKIEAIGIDTSKKDETESQIPDFGY